MTTTTLTLTVPGARLHYDVRGTAPPVAAPAVAPRATNSYKPVSSTC
jgi:hypothetical protein